MQPHVRQRLRMLRVPVAYAAAETQQSDVRRLCYQLKYVLATAQQPNYLIYALSLLEQLAGQHALAEVHAFKALFELALFKLENALETLRQGVRARAEPLELLQDVELALCAVLNERPRVRLFKPGNDVFSAKYCISFEVRNMLYCCVQLAAAPAARRGCTAEQAGERGRAAIAEVEALRARGLGAVGAEAEEEAAPGRVDGASETARRRDTCAKDSKESARDSTATACSDEKEADEHADGAYSAARSKERTVKPASARYSLPAPRPSGEQQMSATSDVGLTKPRAQTQAMKTLTASKTPTTLLASSRPATAGLARARLIYTRAQTQIRYVYQPGQPARRTLQQASRSTAKPVCRDYASTFAAETPRYLQASASIE